LNTAAIVGFGRACEIQHERLPGEISRMERLRDRLEEGILSLVTDAWVNGDPLARLCNTTNMGFRGVDSRALIRDMHTVAVATRSACSSGNTGPSHVLQAIGLTDADAFACVRFSVGRFTTIEEIDYAIDAVSRSVHKLRTNEP
jgi:cysteine desulfurase